MTQVTATREALILAGGLGSRLRTVVSNVPKPMAPLHGRPFLEYLLDYWREQGITRFVIAIGHLGHIISTHFGDNYKQTPIDYVQEDTPLGTGGAVYRALQAVLWSDNYIVLLNGDTWFNVDLARLQEDALYYGKPVTLVLKEVATNTRYGAVDLDGSGIVRAFNVQRNSTALINSGCYLLLREQVAADMATMPSKFSLERDFLEPYARQGKMAGSVQKGTFIDIGIPDDYAKIQTVIRDPLIQETL